jgi:eukaryotic-like serine/threonine-protein kinase
MTEAKARAAPDGRYELIELIGNGGMAQVWRARDSRLGREVAVKVIAGTGARDASRARRVTREARAMAAISHPNVLAVYDYGEDADGEPFIVTELVDGPDLRACLEKDGPFAPDRAVEIMRGVLSGVEVAHAAGIVHGDLKPANVLLSTDGPKVGDFGVARVLSEETGTTTVAATPTFAAPEVLKGERATPASDVYSAACLAFQLLTGRAPYDGSNGWEVAAKHIQEPVPHIREFREVARELDSAIHRGMAKDPQRRFASAAAFGEALGEPARSMAVASTIPIGAPKEDTVILDGRPDLERIAVLGPLAPLWTRVRGWFSRGPSWLPLVVLVPLLLVMALLAFNSPGPELVGVPDVRGKTLTEAVETLQQAGLKPDVAYRPITSGQAGLVAETVPAQNARVKPGSSVHVFATALARTPAPAPQITAAPTQEVTSNVARQPRVPRKKHGKGHD